MTIPSATLLIDPMRSRTVYSRHIFGHFIEHFHRQIYGGVFEPGSPLADDRGFRLDVLEALRELRIPNVRWPGGCFVSAYHWVDGVGPDRTPVFDPAWRVTDPNTFGTDEFIQWCRELGADPYICTNAGTGTPSEMADWLEYTNRPTGSRWADLRGRNGHPEPYAVPFWSIGNENYGAWEIGAKSADEWADFVTESAKLMRRYDADIRLLAAAVDDPEWSLPLLARAGRYLDYISIHGYWDALAERNEPLPYDACMALTVEPEKQIARARALIETSRQDHIRIAFDEWNLRGWHHPSGTDAAAIAARDLNDDNSTYTMADAVFSAAFLNSCLRNADIVGMANLAPTVNTRGPLFVHPDGVVKRTTFHVMQMYSTLLGSAIVDAELASVTLRTGHGDVPMVDAVVTAHDDGRLTAVLVNKSAEAEASVRVQLGGSPMSGSFASVVLSGADADSFNDVDRPDAVMPREEAIRFDAGVAILGPHSVTVVDLGAAQLPTVAGGWTVGRGIRETTVQPT